MEFVSNENGIGAECEQFMTEQNNFLQFIKNSRDDALKIDQVDNEFYGQMDGHKNNSHNTNGQNNGNSMGNMFNIGSGQSIPTTGVVPFLLSDNSANSTSANNTTHMYANPISDVELHTEGPPGYSESI